MQHVFTIQIMNSSIALLVKFWMKGKNMSNLDKPSSKLIDATRLVETLEFRTGVSAKSGNPYIIGSVKIKTASGRPYKLDLSYLDENDQIQIEDALAKLENSAKNEFSEGLEG